MIIKRFRALSVLRAHSAVSGSVATPEETAEIMRLTVSKA